jgi:hypothetical protein
MRFRITRRKNEASRRYQQARRIRDRAEIEMQASEIQSIDNVNKIQPEDVLAASETPLTPDQQAGFDHFMETFRKQHPELKFDK